MEVPRDYRPAKGTEHVHPEDHKFLNPIAATVIVRRRPGGYPAISDSTSCEVAPLPRGGRESLVKCDRGVRCELAVVPEIDLILGAGGTAALAGQNLAMHR